MINTMKKAVYHAFGYRISSEFPLPELPRWNGPEIVADIEIEWADLTQIWSIFSDNTENLIVRKKFVLLRIEKTAIFSVHEGKKIMVSPMPGAYTDQIRRCILRTCMAVLFMQRGCLPLHGNAIAINGRAYCFIGDTGIAEETLASSFSSRGFPLLSSNATVVPLSHEGNAPYVHSMYHDEPVPLAGIIEITTADCPRIEIRLLQGQQRLHTLFIHTYTNFLLPRFEMIDEHHGFLSHITETTEFFQIRRPSSRCSTDETIDSILQVTAKRSSNEDG